MSRLFVEGATLLGLTDRRDIRRACDVYVEEGTIRATGEDARRLAEQPGGPVERLPARGKLVLPGFVQAHLHLCQTLLRNGPEDLDLLAWLREHVWPAADRIDRHFVAAIDDQNRLQLGFEKAPMAGLRAGRQMVM